MARRDWKDSACRWPLHSNHDSPDLEYNRPDLTADQRAQLGSRGFAYVEGFRRFNENSTFHSLEYLKREWSSLFTLRHFEGHGLGHFQDLSLWERK